MGKPTSPNHLIHQAKVLKQNNEQWLNACSTTKRIAKAVSEAKPSSTKEIADLVSLANKTYDILKQYQSRSFTQEDATEHEDCLESLRCSIRELTALSKILPKTSLQQAGMWQQLAYAQLRHNVRPDSWSAALEAQENNLIKLASGSN